MAQERGYVVKEGRALRATSRGRVLSAFLQQYFTQYVDYSFTSDMEAQLDDIAGGVPSLTPCSLGLMLRLTQPACMHKVPT